LSTELLYQIALTLVPNIGDIHAKALINNFETAAAVFSASKKDLESLEGIGTVRANSIKKFNDFKRAEEEVAFVEKYKITPLFLTDKNYPKRLLNCYDSPSILYYKGNADLNSPKIIAIVGTRTHNEYGKTLCEKLIEELASEDVIIISGLAFGIDSIAHKTSVKYNVKTIGVMAHGLDMVYPSQNSALAKQMITNGGLLTEFKSQTKPDRQNFPSRNRIVAGISDAIVVIESGIKGGSLITAELGNGYNKDVFAFPGRVNDTKSEGCNFLIKIIKQASLLQQMTLLKIWDGKRKKIFLPKSKENYLLN